MKKIKSYCDLCVYCGKKNLFQNVVLGILVCVFLFPVDGFSQNENPDLIERTTEKLSETTDKPIDFSEISDVLDQLQGHPINLNNTNHEELSKLLFLDDRQINNLIQYIQSYGTIYSIYELKVVDGFDSATILKILPYVSVGQEMEKHPIRLKDLLKEGRNQLLIRADQVVQKQAGYHVADTVLEKNPNAGYAGSPVKLYFRYTYSFYNRLSIGLSGEKDAGEQFFRGNQKNGMDFYSGYISLQNTGFLKQITIGNFNVDFGQGLTLSSGISAGAIPGTGNVRKYARGVVPSQSTNEGNYLRGVAVVLKKWNFKLSLFYSNHKRDANVIAVDTVTGDAKMISSFSETGYHRTPREIEDKNVLRESIYGGNINFRNSFLSIGFTGFLSHWNASLEPKVYPYNLFTFHGKENLNFGIDFQVALRNAFLFGECARSRDGGMAFLSGIQLNPDPRLMFSLSLRDYQRNYQDLLSNALGQNSANANEEGVLFTFNAGIAQQLSLTGYADLYRFPWLKYRTDSPSYGSEYQLQSDYTAGKFVKMYLRFRIRSKQINATENVRPVNILEQGTSITLRYQADWQVSEFLLLKSRFEWLRNRNGDFSPAYGYLLSQALSYKLPLNHFSLAFLYALFDTDYYNERIYAYESDVLYGYSVPSYYGKGIRGMILSEWSPYRWFELWLRYGQTWYSDRNVIGSGLDLINGNTKSEVEIQLRIRF
ncbi:MAG: helix-hairpin-helix domain-containing protein [Bacteroidales bacterium]